MCVSLETSFDSISVIDAGADHIQEGVTRKVGVAGVVERFGGGPGEPEALVELADGQQPGIARELPRRWLDHQRRAEEG